MQISKAIEAAQNERVTEFLGNQERIIRAIRDGKTIPKFKVHGDGAYMEIDLSATDPAYFLSEIINQAYKTGLLNGRDDKVREIRNALKYDGEE